MSNFGFGYGSQWHLLRYLGYHRQRLNDTIREQVGGRAIEWLDFPFSEWIDPLWQDRELVGLEFIANHVHAALAWTKFWPQQGTFHNWDAIAKITYDSHEEWLLVEAKATVGEMRSSCRATNPVSLDTIQAAFDAARPSFGADAISSTAWLTPFYQYCNRLTMLHFLQQACQPIVRARMLFIYFYGDMNPGQECPQSAAAWQPSITAMHKAIGVTPDSGLMNRVHHVYLPVNPDAKRRKFPIAPLVP